MTRSVKFRVLAAVAVGLVLLASGAFAAGLGPDGSTVRKARLTLVSGAPLVVAGQGFRSRERVTVTASVGGQRVRRSLAANAAGRFTARFRTGPADCGPIYVLAVGRSGSRAVVRQQLIPAPCGIDPAPAVELER
jgi:hypothetical protein